LELNSMNDSRESDRGGFVDREGWQQDAELSLLDVWLPVKRRRRPILIAVAVATILAIVGVVVHNRLQPVRRIASLQFHSTFAGAAIGKYPDGLRFSPTDIIDASLLDRVYDANDIAQYCEALPFRSGFSLRASTPVQFLLTFAPDQCAGMPDSLVIKVMDDTLSYWARDAETNHRAPAHTITVLSPQFLDAQPIATTSMFLRADLLWVNIDRILSNIDEVQLLDGAQRIQDDAHRQSLAEIATQLRELQRLHLESLMAEIRPGDDPDAARFVEMALDAASGEQQRAAARAQAYLTALHEYSGPARSISLQGGAPRETRETDPARLATEPERTANDRVLDIATLDTNFRQQLTRSMLAASLQGAHQATLVNHYRQLLARIRSGGQRSGGAAGERLAGILEKAKTLTARFNAVYEESSKKALRAAPEVYRVDTPASVVHVRAVGTRTYALLVFAVALITLSLAALAAVLESRRAAGGAPAPSGH
jgi:hypothetical protein